MKKIVFVIWCGNAFGGMERRYARLATELSKNVNYDVSVIAQKRAERSISLYCQSSRVKIKFLNRIIFKASLSGKFQRLLELSHLIYLMFHNANTTIICCSNPGYISCLLALFKKRAQNLIVANAMLFSDLPVTALHRICACIVANRADKIDNLSEEPKKVLNKLVPKVLMSSEHHIAPCSFTNYDAIINSTKKDIDLLMLARFVDGKGYELLEQIDEFFKQYHLHICGFGKREILVKNAQIYRTDKPFQLLARTKIFLALQASNNYPSQSLVEAMASGCAIIATDVGETRKLLDDTCAILISPSSLELKTAITKLLKNQSTAKKLGIAARERVLKFQTIERYRNYFEQEILLDG